LLEQLRSALEVCQRQLDERMGLQRLGALARRLVWQSQLAALLSASHELGPLQTRELKGKGPVPTRSILASRRREQVSARPLRAADGSWTWTAGLAGGRPFLRS
jgi:hypothetical protein